MAREKIDWDRLKLEFVHDPLKPELKDFAQTQKIGYGTLRDRAGKEKWIHERDSYWGRVVTKTTPLLEDMQAVVMARDVASKLTWIDELRQLGLELARAITVKDSQAGYGEIVTAIERVEKLERLILGESTEIIKVDDARAMVQQIVAAAHREVRDDDDRNRFLAALEHLGPAQTRSISTLN